MDEKRRYRREHVFKVAFFGSPNFSAQLLERLVAETKDHVQVVLVVTQPNRPAGRGMHATETPVKKVAQKYCIPVYDTPLKSSSDKLQELLAKQNIDLALVYAFNEIIPDHILSIPSMGFWNMHPSLLPKHRGASPITFPLILHEKETGVSLMQMVHKMDAGPLIAQRNMAIERTDLNADLQGKLATLGFSLFIETIRVAKTVGTLPPPTPQNDEAATYTFKIKREDGYFELNNLKTLLSGKDIPCDTVGIYNKIIQKNPSLKPQGMFSLRDLYDMWRGLTPWPGIWTQIITKDGQKRLKIIHMTSVDGVISIDKVQIEGKNIVSFDIFLKGYPHVLG